MLSAAPDVFHVIVPPANELDISTIPASPSCRHRSCRQQPPTYITMSANITIHSDTKRSHLTIQRGVELSSASLNNIGGSTPRGVARLDTDVKAA
jgi:hypothetical protein